MTTVQAGCVYPESDPEPWEGFGWARYGQHCPSSALCGN